MLVFFVFLAGLTGSAALCNVAGTIADSFGDGAAAGQGMARRLLWLSTSVGPSLGGPVGERFAENPQMGYPCQIDVTIGAIYATGVALLPETLAGVVIPRTGKQKDGVEVELPMSRRIVLDGAISAFTMALKIMITEPIVLSLGLYNDRFCAFPNSQELADGRYMGGSLTFLNFAAAGVISFVLFVPACQTGSQEERRENSSRVSFFGLPSRVRAPTYGRPPELLD
ncbi:uncharacterized protein EI90DRAFT_3289185 [Cantharellus anzutake]|uniref:uncharacterized protein n=1 Tax=Cantharellus anzutake TaxID=1750568 RepID=UPI00190729E8|nr:uncharacterized protein EI90DRAFT_3289185 [Cantharellus anzutake]KAF8331943.1 hypothetical protein EI90DRAFT_3289185 [Cantharellus anzutake]